jgi:phytoene dehydrogenase-like protein
MVYDAIVVGGGIAGLVATAYLSKAKKNVLLCEKQANCGGLINSFERDGFLYDGGIRALEDSGVLFPMLNNLGIEIEFVKNHVSMGIEDRVIQFASEESLEDYQALLTDLYPESAAEIVLIIEKIREIMHYMEIQYGIKNPMFLDFKKDREYMLKEIMPWMYKYATTVGKISAMNEPAEDYLRQFTHNQALLDIITQHFFQKTPAFFALSYLKIYLDYNYPCGGTGKIIEAIVDFIRQHGGEIRTDCVIEQIDPVRHQLIDQQGNVYEYRQLIWAADNQILYRSLDLNALSSQKQQSAIQARQQLLQDKRGNDSIFTLYLAVDRDRQVFEKIASEHFFYTPKRDGQSQAGPIPYGQGRDTAEQWLEQYFALTTYEIACPAMRDASLAPAGKTGLIISVLFDYQFAKQIQEQGWYEEFKQLCEDLMINALDQSIFPGIRGEVIHQFSSTPLTMEQLTGNHQGAITGWSFLNEVIPAESRLPRIMNAVRTPVPDVFQAGQWTYSPSGLPISILTGKIAADQVIRKLRKKQ